MDIDYEEQNSFMKQVMTLNRLETKAMFEQLVNETIDQADNNEQFKYKMEQKIMEQMNRNRQTMEVIKRMMVDESEQLMNEWMNDIVDKMDGQQYHSIDEINNTLMNSIIIQNESVHYDQYNSVKNELSEMKSQYEELKEFIRRQKEEINQQMNKKCQLDKYEDKYRMMVQCIEKQQDDMKYEMEIPKDMRQLKECSKYIDICDPNKLDNNTKHIQKYEQDNEQYEIRIDFQLYNTSLEYKVKLMDMLDRLNVNTKVGRIRIKLDNNNEFDEQILNNVINRYHNIYHIIIHDYSNSIDSKLHSLLQQLVKQQVVMEFRLWFSRYLYQSNYAFDLMKEYNELIKQKQYLKYLSYGHDRIGGMKGANSEQQVCQLIDQTTKS